MMQFDLSRRISRLENSNVPRRSLALSNVMLHECLFEQCCLWLRPNNFLTSTPYFYSETFESTKFLTFETQLTEVESSRTSLASRTSSRTHFEVLCLGLGLGLVASSPWPWPWPRSLKSSKIALSSARGQLFEQLKFR